MTKVYNRKTKQYEEIKDYGGNALKHIYKNNLLKGDNEWKKLLKLVY